MEHLGAGRAVQDVPISCVNGKLEERWLSMTLSLQGKGLEQIVADHITDIHDHMSRQRFLEKLTNNVKENTANSPTGLAINSHYQGPKTFVSYEEPLTIIIKTLIDNSIKHGLANSECGQINIELLIQDDYCEINYHDNSIGLKEEIKDHIFQPFFTTSRGKSDTSGLGLYAIDNIVSNLFQGHLHIMDNDQGFHLSIQLPPVKLDDR